MERYEHVGKQGGRGHKTQYRVALPRPGNRANGQTQHHAIDDANGYLVPQHPQCVAHGDFAQGEGTNDKRHGLVAGASALAGNDGHKHRQNGDGRNGVFVVSDDKGSHERGRQLHKQPGQSVADRLQAEG